MPDLGRKSPAKAWDEDSARGIAAGLKDVAGPLLPILHALNEQFGYVDERAIPVVAEVLNLSRAEVHGVISFYHDFRHEPAGRHVIRVCRAEACQAMGSEAVVAALEKALGISCGGTTADGRVTVEAVYCLGNCALSPAAFIDGKLYGRVDATRALGLVRS